MTLTPFTNVSTLGQLVANGAQETFEFSKIEANINALHAHSVLQCLEHHKFFHDLEGTFGLDGTIWLGGASGMAEVAGRDDKATEEMYMKALEDCYLAQNAHKGFMFVLFNPFGKLLHVYIEKMFITKKEDGLKYLIGYNDPAGSIEEKPLTDTFVTYLFNSLDEGQNILPNASNEPGEYQRLSYDLGGGNTLQTSTTQIREGSVLKGYVMGLQIKRPHDKKK